MFTSHPFLAFAVACVACGSSFTARDGNSGASGGVGTAGEASGGLASAAGSGNAGEAGEMDAAGASSAGDGPTAGSSAGGGSGRGGWGSGGWGSGNGGNWGGSECSTLRQEYMAAVEKARVCTKGSTDECSPTSVAEPIGCGCPVLINAKSEYVATATKAYQAFKDANCDFGRGSCSEAICAPAVTASCAQPSMTSGNTFVCTAGVVLN